MFCRHRCCHDRRPPETSGTGLFRQATGYGRCRCKLSRAPERHIFLSEMPLCHQDVFFQRNQGTLKNLPLPRTPTTNGLIQTTLSDQWQHPISRNQHRKNQKEHSENDLHETTELLQQIYLQSHQLPEADSGQEQYLHKYARHHHQFYRLRVLPHSGQR